MMRARSTSLSPYVAGAGIGVLSWFRPPSPGVDGWMDSAGLRPFTTTPARPASRTSARSFVATRSTTAAGEGSRTAGASRQSLYDRATPASSREGLRFYWSALTDAELLAEKNR